MVNRKNSPDNDRALKRGILTIIKKIGMLRFVSDHPETKKICKKRQLRSYNL